MATIPEIRERLHEVADELRHRLLFPRSMDDIAAELDHLAAGTWRRKKVTDAPVVSRKATPSMARQIRQCHAEHPNWTQQRVAEHFGVIAGRVSEALAGKRT